MVSLFERLIHVRKVLRNIDSLAWYTPMIERAFVVSNLGYDTWRRALTIDDQEEKKRKERLTMPFLIGPFI